MSWNIVILENDSDDTVMCSYIMNIMYCCIPSLCMAMYGWCRRYLTILPAYSPWLDLTACDGDGSINRMLAGTGKNSSREEAETAAKVGTEECTSNPGSLIDRRTVKALNTLLGSSSMFNHLYCHRLSGEAGMESNSSGKLCGSPGITSIARPEKWLRGMLPSSWLS